jgi:DNA-binding XRE family transcriptional regulator
MVSTVTLEGKKYVMMPQEEYQRLVARAEGDFEVGLPPLPSKDADGNYPALEALDVSIAREIIRTRRQLGLSQAELARRAGVRIETLNRIEKVKVTPSVATIDKIDRVLREARAAASASRRKRKARGKAGTPNTA